MTFFRVYAESNSHAELIGVIDEQYYDLLTKTLEEIAKENRMIITEAQVEGDGDLTNPDTHLEKALILMNEAPEKPKHTSKITISWNYEDIQCRWADMNDAEPEDCPLTEEQMGAILDAMEKNHDANIGMNWDIVDFWIDKVDSLVI